jgi:hypothetical protein
MVRKGTLLVTDDPAMTARSRAHPTWRYLLRLATNCRMPSCSSPFAKVRWKSLRSSRSRSSRPTECVMDRPVTATGEIPRRSFGNNRPKRAQPQGRFQVKAGINGQDRLARSGMTRTVPRCASNIFSLDRFQRRPSGVPSREGQTAQCHPAYATPNGRYRG